MYLCFVSIVVSRFRDKYKRLQFTKYPLPVAVAQWIISATLPKLEIPVRFYVGSAGG